jgi:DNA polymerase-3 subunit delta
MLYVFVGPDQTRAREELQALRTKLDREGNLGHQTLRLDARGLSPADLRAACHAASFFADDRLVIVDGLQARFSGTRRRSGGRAPARSSARASAAATEFDQFVDILTTLPPTTAVVLLDEQPQVAFMEAVRDTATVQEFGVLKGDALRSWAEARIKKQGASFSAAALDRLLTLIDGAHLGELANEIDKLATYAGERRVEPADIDAMVSSALEYQIWDLTDAVVAGRADRALGFIETMAVRGGRDYAPQLLIFMLTRTYRQLLLAQTLMAERLTQPEIGQRLGLSPFPLRKTIEQAGRYPPERLEQAYRRLLETDVAVKTGVLDVDTALELLVGDLTELAQTPRRTPARR